THSYLKFLYKYPQRVFPYSRLIEESARRTREDPEFELLDTGIFDDDRYFDVFVEYTKASPTDILMRVTAYNRGPDYAPLHLLPQLWFRNRWSWRASAAKKPSLAADSDTSLQARQERLGDYWLYCDGRPELLFCENETNAPRLFGKNDARLRRNSPAPRRVGQGCACSRRRTNACRRCLRRISSHLQRPHSRGRRILRRSAS
ncbi:MAG: hypothetical protein JF612_02905, partial [Planctomycetia bacterium]|nr:hypothetical protein [Planctomycetia bacterium]